MKAREILTTAFRVLNVALSAVEVDRAIEELRREFLKLKEEKALPHKLAVVYPYEESFVLEDEEGEKEEFSSPVDVLKEALTNYDCIIYHQAFNDDFLLSVEGTGFLRKVHEKRSDGLVFIVVAVSPKLPEEYDRFFFRADYDFPTEEELREYLYEYLRENTGFPEMHLDADGEGRLRTEKLILSYARGLTLTEFEQAIALGIEKTKEGFYLDVNRIKQVKENLIKRNPLLELYHPEDVDTLVGLEKAFTFSLKAIEKGKGKGILLLGVPGIGKSLLAKNLSREVQIPTVIFNLSRVFGKYVGESEQNMRQALKTIDELGECVLFLDEIDKQLVGFNDSTGVSQRIMGMFLTWLQERKNGAFVIATANRIDHIPEEFFRSGRWNAIFFAGYYPTDKHYEKLLTYYAGKEKLSEEQIDLTPRHLKELKLTGAEIRDMCEKAAILEIPCHDPS